MRLSVYAIISACLVASTYAAFGKCPAAKPTKNVDTRLIQGTWHLVRTFSGAYEKCVNYWIEGSPAAITLKRHSVNSIWPHGETDKESELIANLGSPELVLRTKAWYFFKSTTAMTLRVGDYDQFLIFYTCIDHVFGTYHTEHSEIWSRQKKITDSVKEQIDTALDQLKISKGSYNTVEQSCK